MKRKKRSTFRRRTNPPKDGKFMGPRLNRGKGEGTARAIARESKRQ